MPKIRPLSKNCSLQAADRHTDSHTHTDRESEHQGPRFQRKFLIVEFILKERSDYLNLIFASVRGSLALSFWPRRLIFSMRDLWLNSPTPYFFSLANSYFWISFFCNYFLINFERVCRIDQTKWYRELKFL